MRAAPARVRAPRRQRVTAARIVGAALLGVGAVLLGGVLGMVLLGRLSGTAAALWVAVLAVTLVPRFVPRLALWPRLRTPTQPRS